MPHMWNFPFYSPFTGRKFRSNILRYNHPFHQKSNGQVAQDSRMAVNLTVLFANLFLPLCPTLKAGKKDGQNNELISSLSSEHIFLLKVNDGTTHPSSHLAGDHCYQVGVHAPGMFSMHLCIYRNMSAFWFFVFLEGSLAEN